MINKKNCNLLKSLFRLWIYQYWMLYNKIHNKKKQKIYYFFYSQQWKMICSLLMKVSIFSINRKAISIVNFIVWYDKRIIHLSNRCPSPSASADCNHTEYRYAKKAGNCINQAGNSICWSRLSIHLILLISI